VAPEQIPVEAEAAAGLYRTLLADRRVLILLDNAHVAEQVRPLLPASPGSLVLVTSRDRLIGLAARDGARRLPLGVLAPAEAAELLARLLGRDRVQAEPDAAAELAHACAFLPLALWIAAANLADQPGRRIAEYTSELRAGNRLALLAVDDDHDSAVKAAFDVSYQGLAPDARRLFRLLGLLPGQDVTAEGAAALAHLAPKHARVLLGRLAAAHLVDQHAPGRFSFHDLLREYAAERARQMRVRRTWSPPSAGCSAGTWALRTRRRGWRIRTRCATRRPRVSTVNRPGFRLCWRIRPSWSV
jgi:hypothetical protein